MATPNKIENGLGALAAPGRVSLDKDGKITSASILSVNSFLEDTAKRVSGHLSFGDGTVYSRSGNIDGQWVELKTPTVADTEITVYHSLGRVPIGYLVLAQNKAGSLYTSQYASWSTSATAFKCNVASVLFTIILL